MNEQRRRLVWLLAVGVAQIGLAVAVLELCLVRTTIGVEPEINHGWPIIGKYLHFDGYPTPWVEYAQTFAQYSGPIGSPQEELGTLRRQGINRVVPGAMLLIALSLPPVVGTIGPRIFQRIRKAEITPSSRLFGILSVVLFASLITTLFAWLESELTVWSVHLDRYWVVSSPTPGTTNYDEFFESVMDGRRWAKRYMTGTIAVPEVDWPTRTHHTIFTFLFAAVVGCVLFRPWRRQEIGYHSSDNRPVSSAAEGTDVAGVDQHSTDHASPGVDPRGRPVE
jgi:hypothetical protein